MKKRLLVRYIFLALSVAVMALIFYFSSQDGNKSGELSGWWAEIVRKAFNAINMPSAADFVIKYVRKFAHVFIYVCLGFCVSVCTFTFPVKHKWLYLAIPFIICFIYACSDELHQLFVTGREGKFTDVLIDTIGFASITILLNIIWFFTGRRKQKKKSAE